MRRNGCSLALFGICLACAAWGQGLSTISGIVTDPTGSLIPGAKITVIEVGTRLPRTAFTSSDGYYAITSLRPTDYNLTSEAPGFRTYSQTGITLLANESVTINLKLELGPTSETVSVQANAVQVDTTTATLRQVVDSERMIELPASLRSDDVRVHPGMSFGFPSETAFGFAVTSVVVREDK